MMPYLSCKKIENDVYNFPTWQYCKYKDIFDSRIIINSTAKFYISISYQKDLLSIDTRIFTPSFFLAYAIEERIKSKKADGKAFSRTFYRTLFFIPVVTSVTVVAIMFSKIFQPYQGIIGHYLNSWFGMSPTINVLGNSKAALWGIMLANIWEWTGWSMIMYIGGISQISEDVKEAARIDGANTWQEIIYIYIPALGSVHKSLLMLGIIGSLQTYALIGVMTGGGPNHATEMPGTYIFMKGFTESQMGYACAISVAVLIFALVLTFIQVRFLGSGDFMKKGE